MSSGNYNQILTDHWDRLYSGSGTYAGSDASQNITPFQFVDRDDPETLLTWHDKVITILEEENLDRAATQINNINFYEGIQKLEREGGRVYGVDRYGRALDKNARLVMNHARDFVNQSVSRIGKYSSNVAVLPVNNEYTDRLGARTSKRVVDNIFYLNDSKDIFPKWIQEMKLCGETFCFPQYNPFKGDISKITTEYLEQKRSEAIRNGQPFREGDFVFVNSDGDKVPLDFVSRTGEVDWVHPLPFFVLHQPASKWKDVNYIYYAEIRHIDEVAAENPGIDIEKRSIPLKMNQGLSNSPGFKYGNWVLEYKFFHKRAPFLDEGWYCKFIPGVMLDSRVCPYDATELPVARLTDYDSPQNAHGISFLEDLKAPLVMYNKMMGLMYRNMAYANHPKIMMPRGTCDISQMANGPMVVEYEYPMKPEVITFNGNGTEIFRITQDFMSDVTKFSGTFDISRGGNIPNARAASILNFYEEQEEQRESNQIKKYSAFVEKVARISLGIAGKFYRPDDGRTLRVVGKRNFYKIEQLDDVTKLSGPYDIKVERTTALSESKQGRIDQIVQLSQVPLSSSQGDAQKPGLFTREQILRMLEVSDINTFFEMATAAAEKQESENEDMFEGKEVPAPEEWEAHVVCWNVLFQFLQSREFLDTKGVPDKVKQNLLNHLAAHEMFMYFKAEQSLTFAQELMTNLYYPARLTIGKKAQLPGFQRTINQIIQDHLAPPPPPMPAGAPQITPGQSPGQSEDMPDNEVPEPGPQGEPTFPDQAEPTPQINRATSDGNEQVRS